MDNKKIAVYYIATGDYKKLFPKFLESLDNFFPESIKIVKLISDGLEEYKNYEKNNIKVDLCPRINDYPWPVVTLYKMWHILENFDDETDYSCYFNANSVVYPHAKDVFNLNKLTMSYHSFNSKNAPYDPWPYININPSSVAYQENKSYEYVQGAFFFGPNSLFKKMCEDIVMMVKQDTSRMIFAQWHDESYLNKWCTLNPTFVNKQYVLAVYESDLDDNTFVFLRDKRIENINRK